MDYSHFAVLLLLLSLALLVAEVFVPSGGILAAMTLIAVVGSVFCAFQAWWEASPKVWWGYVASLFVLLPGVAVAAFMVFPRTPYGRRVLLDAPAPEEIAAYTKEQAELRQLVGRRAKTVTLHNPGGMVSVEGRRFHSETRGMMVGPGEEVEVVAVKGNRVVVRPAGPPTAAAAGDAAPLDVAAVPPLGERLEPRFGSEERSAEPPREATFDPFLDDTRQA